MRSDEGTHEYVHPAALSRWQIWLPFVECIGEDYWKWTPRMARGKTLLARMIRL